MTAIIVNDEKHCSQVMEHLLHIHCSTAKVLANCSGGDEALSALEKETPDILFLNIQITGVDDFELLKKFDLPGFEIVFTAAHNECALKVIKHRTLKYLLKPVDKDELIQLFYRAKEYKTLKASKRAEGVPDILNSKNINKRFAVPTFEGLIMVDSETILYCESDSAYCKIYFINSNKPLVISKTLKQVEDVLPGNDFCRIHNSYLANIQYIQSYIRGKGGEVVLNNGVHLPVSKTRKQHFLNLLQKI